LSGGNNTYNYTLSLGYNNALSNIQYTKPNQQFTINSNNIFRPVKNLEFTVGVGVAKTTQYASNLSYPINVGGGKNYLYPYASLADQSGNPLAIPKDYGSVYTDTAGAGRLLDWKYRPIDEIRFANNRGNILFGRINLGVAYKLTSWLKADVQYQYIIQDGENRNLQGLELYATRNTINLFTNLNQSASSLRNPLPIGAILDVSNYSSRNYNFRSRLSFNKKIANGHELTAFIATDVSESRSNSNGNRFYGYNDEIGTYATGLDHITNFTYYGGIASGRILQGSGISEGATTRFVSVSANANYTLFKRYNFYVSGRRDGANVFGVNTNNKWKPLWSSGMSWEISKEKFYHLSWLPYLRFRATYGYMGNVDNARSGLPTIGYAPTNLPLTNLPSATIGNAPNPDLQWEEVRTTNLALDFTMLKERLSGSIEWYQKLSKDIISNIPFDATTGVPLFVVNAAHLRGRGVELQLNAIPVKAGHFTWAINFAMAYNKTVVTKYYNGGFKVNQFTSYGINPSEGRIAWGISSYRWAGLDPQTGDPRGYLNGQISNNYTAILNDSVKNQVFHGSSIPLYTGFFSNTFTWKQFSLSAIIKYNLDYYFRKTTINYNNLFNVWLGHNDYARRWKVPGDEVYTDIPSMSYPSNSRRDDFFQNSEVNVLKGDHVRLQDIRLSYNWVKKTPAKGFIQSAQLFIYTNNLNIILWRANDEKLDPEFTGGSSGIDLPTARSWTFGINVGF
ncbi:MAG TPA: hypothetical protein VHM26_08815, partial [Chitinophagaceae bacterium]|nr:hypothetical protein [Chitinophagaceae bacterium]